MLFTLDESGKDGLMPQPGRSPWLVVGGALFPTRDAAAACRLALTELRKSLGGREFHFTKDGDDRKRSVLACLAEQEFTFHAAVCDRTMLRPEKWRHKTAEDLHHAVATHLMVTLQPVLADCTVWFDSLGGDPADKRLKTVLTRAAGHGVGGRSRVTECGVRKSEKELTIQVADYVCGAVARSRHPTRGDPLFRRLIHRREGQVVEWVETVVAVEVGPANEGSGELSPPASPQ